MSNQTVYATGPAAQTPKRYHCELRDWLAGELGIALPDYDALPRGGSPAV